MRNPHAESTCRARVQGPCTEPVFDTGNDDVETRSHDMGRIATGHLIASPTADRGPDGARRTCRRTCRPAAPDDDTD